MHTETCSCACRGGMIFTFYKARGMSVGSSLVEEDKLDLAKKLEEAAKAKGVEFILPTDVVIADKFDENANINIVSADAIPDGWMVRVLPLPATYAWKEMQECIARTVRGVEFILPTDVVIADKLFDKHQHQSCLC